MQRIVEVIEMSMRDLVYRIVPTKLIIRELKTSLGKVLTKDSEYVLVEKKQVVQVGKKSQVNYVFELDIKEEVPVASVVKQEEEKASSFYLNLDDFNLFKLRSTIFLIDFPLSFTISMMNIWIKIVPLPTSEYGFSKEESEQILSTRTIIKEFGIGMQEHLKQLQNYLKELLKSKPLLQNYLEIQNFKSF